MKQLVAEALLRAVDAETAREERARAAAEVICDAGGYRWVGIYDVGDEQITIIGQTGPIPPVHERFPITQGLSGEAVTTRATVTTDSETVVPVLGAESGIPIGTLDVECARDGAFSDDSVAFLEECAALLRPLYD
jgi:putative methionine-R-sulfoxide reductase with GAF domain